ncbi:MAG: electron transfer flavoprotein subunit alpha/FixB family protein [Spirochaetes bacterium]|nr:electron transfer flavoprotein subunit alpha/FixB family protein [Spirochaetota bacterium]
MSGKNDLWVLVERFERTIRPVVFELLTKGKELCSKRDSKKPGDLVAVAFEGVTAEENARLGSYGARRVLQIGREGGNAATYMEEARLLVSAAREYHPAILLAGATAYGRSVMPLVAVELRTGLTADCTGLDIDPESGVLLQTRPAFGGNVLATIECAGKRPQMATVRPGVFKKRAEGKHAVEARERCYRIPSQPLFRVLERTVEDRGFDITGARVIVAGGRGLARSEGFSLLEKLAKKLGGVVGASRGAVDLGWIDAAHQVGQTGHTVTPALYVACGISGAVQHLAGMKDSDTIVAINEDPQAPIFEAAEYGIVGDLYEVIPRIIERMG